jgi:hypothetical protein
MPDKHEMSKLVTTNSYEARVLHARLQSSGIDAKLQEGLAAQYAVGAAQIWVPTSQLSHANEVMAATDFTEPDERDATRRPQNRRTVKIFAFILLSGFALTIFYPLVRIIFGS